MTSGKKNKTWKLANHISKDKPRLEFNDFLLILLKNILRNERRFKY